MVFVAATKACSSVGNLANTRAVADSNLYDRVKGREREREREEVFNHFQHVIFNVSTCTCCMHNNTIPVNITKEAQYHMTTNNNKTPRMCRHHLHGKKSLCKRTPLPPVTKYNHIGGELPCDTIPLGLAYGSIIICNVHILLHVCLQQ